MSRKWYPIASKWKQKPEDGDLVAQKHAVWQVTNVQDVPVLTDEDRATWLTDGMPDLETWQRRPYRVEAKHVGGVRPTGKPSRRYLIDVPAGTYFRWDVYPNGRWPQCSCCGEPMPCRAALEDETVQHANTRMQRFEDRLPGTCWGCGEVITTRQRCVTYPGINLDLPTGADVRYHLRGSCRPPAAVYEERWLSAGIGRERVITYPACTGSLVVHRDGSSDCRNGVDDCAGHLTHDHGWSMTCQVAEGACLKGCPAGYFGMRLTPRPTRLSGHLS